MMQRGWTRGEPLEELVSREWLVTNGLGGYASGTIGGAATRRFHGKLVAALPAPLGRTMMLNHLAESVTTRDGRSRLLSGDERASGAIVYPDPDFLEEFVLDCGIPLWRFASDGLRLEKRVVMPYGQNTTYTIYRLIEGEGVTLRLRPSLNFRPHEGLLAEWSDTWKIDIKGRDVEICESDAFPPLRLAFIGEDTQFEHRPEKIEHVVYRIEKGRGYEHEGPLWSPGTIHIALARGEDAGIVASTEAWDVIHALPMARAIESEQARRHKLFDIANDPSPLIVAADQFLVRPHTRPSDEARIAAMGDTPRTVIAGYHWFTDWGRDTMISLEGLTLVTHRFREAGSILRTFASYVRDGLIPNMFPEGEHGGLYHTADATMWFFHAVARYVKWTDDRGTLRELLPKLVDIIDHHVRGTRFNIHVDPKDGLLSQGEESYQLTWMDAKVDGWVVTPRRGKAVEINALYYNALRILQTFLDEEGDAANAARMNELAERAQKSFNERFWYDEGQYLYDVLCDEMDENDAALRPNQIFALSLDHPVLDRSRWEAVLHTVERELLTPVGLRSLARNHPDYKQRYDGDLRARDAAYHQGTVWGWLIGPFIDAWLRVYPDDRERALHFLDGFQPHLHEACIGTISEVFDAEEPFTPRGCAAQAWSVAEVLRCLHALHDR
ncbi:MAG: glycogen debranching protein [Acidobacteria bacterium]|nr:MAG: glycogen debranching protein [Acidobacteriota bacterium]